MKLFSKKCLEELKEKVKIEEVIQAHMELEQDHLIFKGNCPFHDDKKGSFLVLPDWRSYKCLDCGAHGDAVQFVMTVRNWSFEKTIQMLAKLYDVELETASKKKKFVITNQMGLMMDLQPILDKWIKVNED